MVTGSDYAEQETTRSGPISHPPSPRTPNWTWSTGTAATVAASATASGRTPKGVKGRASVSPNVAKNTTQEAHITHVRCLTVEGIRAVHINRVSCSRPVRLGDSTVNGTREHRQLDVHVSVADAFRATPDDVREVAEALPDVEYLTLADTVAARVPASVRSYLQELGESVDPRKAVLGSEGDLETEAAVELARSAFEP